MIKRYLLIVLSLVLCFSLVVFPVSASGTSDGSMWLTNVLDYTSVNSEDGSNRLAFTGSTSVSITMPFATNFNYVDMVVFSSRGDPSFTWIAPSYNTNLTVELIGNSMYRVYGNVAYKASPYINFDVSVADTSGLNYLTFFQLNIGNRNASYVSTVGTLNLSHPSVSTSTMVSPTSPAVVVLPSVTNTSYYTDFNGFVSVSDWRKFDILDLYLTVDSCTLNSISAACGSVPIPLDYQFIDGNLPGLDGKNDTSSSSSMSVVRYVRVSLDLTNLLRSGNNSIQVNFSGVYDGYNTGSVSLRSVTGFTYASSPDAPVFWLRQLWTTISAGFDRIAELISPESTDTQTSIADAESAIRDVEVMEQTYAAGLDSSVVSSEIGKVGNYGNGLVLCANVLSRTFTKLDGYQIIYILPITIGIFLYIASRARPIDKPSKSSSPKVNNTSSLDQGGSNGSTT